MKLPSPIHLRFALIGGPSDFHVHSVEWAKAAFSIADAVLEIERRSRRDAFGFITDLDYQYGGQGPLRTVVWEMTGRWPSRSHYYPQGIPPKREKMPRGSPKRGRWYLSKDTWRRIRPPTPAVYIYSCERVIPNMFEGACRILSETAFAAGVRPPLVVMPDGGGARPFSNRAESERTRLGALLPAGFDPGPAHSVSVPSLTTMIVETGEQLDAAVFAAALYYLKVRYQSSLSVWDVVNDPLLRGSAIAAQPKVVQPNDP
jgi:hypothetical protein